MINFGIFKKLLIFFNIFFLIQIISLQFIPALPNSSHLSYILSILLCMVFCFSFTAFSFIGWNTGLRFSKNSQTQIDKLTTYSKINLYFYPKIIFFIVLAGLILLLYDRLFIRGIDYSEGLRAARYQWTSSIGGNLSGLFGNLFLSFSIFSLFALAKNNINLKKRRNDIFHVASVLLGCGAWTLLNGGRSPVLVFLISFVCLTIYFKSDFRLSKFIKLLSIATVPVLIVTLSSRNLVSNISAFEHFSSDVTFLGGLLIEDPIRFGVFDEIIFTLYYFIIYLFHGFWSLSISIDLSDTTPFYTFFPIMSIFAQLGLYESYATGGYFSEYGAFVSTPAGLFYDYGFIGVILGGSIISLIWSFFVSFYINRKSLNLIGAGVLFVMFNIVFLSPIITPLGFSTSVLGLLPFVFLWGLSLFSNVRFYL